MQNVPGYDELLAVMKRIADPDDACHAGAGGPWQDLAQTVLFGRATTDGGEWYQDGIRLTVDEMMIKHGRGIDGSSAG